MARFWFYPLQVGPLFATFTFGPSILKAFGIGEGNLSNLGSVIIDLVFLADCIPALKLCSWRAVWAYSRKRAVRDATTLTAQENRAREVIEGQKAARTPRFVKTAGRKRSLDQASLTRARQLAGLKGYVTNIPATIMAATEVIGSYHELWHVEQSSRMSKTDLRARPMFHRTRDAIEAHLTIVFTALAVSRTVQARTGLAVANVVKQLRPLRSATIAINGTTQTFAPDISIEQQTILDAIHSPKSTY